jgi:hypothetical protein
MAETGGKPLAEASVRIKVEGAEKVRDDLKGIAEQAKITADQMAERMRNATQSTKDTYNEVVPLYDATKDLSEATKQAAEQQEELARKMRATVEESNRLTTGIKEVGNRSGFQVLGDQVEGYGLRLRGATEGTFRFLGQVGRIAGVAGGAAFAVIKLGEGLYNLGKRLEEATNGAKRAQQSFEEMTKADTFSGVDAARQKLSELNDELVRSQRASSAAMDSVFNFADGQFRAAIETRINLIKEEVSETEKLVALLEKKAETDRNQQAVQESILEGTIKNAKIRAEIEAEIASEMEAARQAEMSDEEKIQDAYQKRLDRLREIGVERMALGMEATNAEIDQLEAFYARQRDLMLKQIAERKEAEQAAEREKAEREAQAEREKAQREEEARQERQRRDIEAAERAAKAMADAMIRELERARSTGSQGLGVATDQSALQAAIQLQSLDRQNQVVDISVGVRP